MSRSRGWRWASTTLLAAAILGAGGALAAYVVDRGANLAWDDADYVRRGLQLAGRVADVLGRPVEFTDPSTGATESVRVGAPDRTPQLAVRPPGPTPWATGLVVAAYVAVLVTVADVALSTAFADAFGLWWIPANLLVALGLAPSLYLLRRTPLWRWPAIGTAVGLLAAWAVLLLGLLG